jgi:hypothetical protein
VRRDLYIATAVALSASLVLLALAPVYRIEHFYVSYQTIMSNDQVGYLTTARWLADTGELRSHLIYPAHVREPMWRLYMPGQYYVLAAGHLLFGDGPIAWRLPAMLCFVLSAVAVFLIGRRFHGRSSGVIAALLFMAFPPITAFAFTAMPQLPFTAANVTAFCVFSYIPARWRVLLVPILLTGPFLFQETGSFLVIPMALVSLGAGGKREWGRVLAATGCSVLYLYALLHWQFATGKGVIQMDGSGFNYANAFPPPEPPTTMSRYVQLLYDNLWSNIAALEQHASRPAQVFGPFMVMCGLALLAILRGVKWSPPGIRDALALGSALLFVTMVSVVTVFYTWALYRGLRTLLFTFPFLAVSAAPSLVSFLERWTRRVETRFSRPITFVPTWLFMGTVLWIAYWGNQELARRIRPIQGIRAVERMESLGIDESGVLVAPADLSLNYVLRHYPIRWSFIPGNDETFKLLAEKHRVQTVILFSWDLEEGGRLSERTLNDAGLVRIREFQHVDPEVTYVLFQRPPVLFRRRPGSKIALSLSGGR